MTEAYPGLGAGLGYGLLLVVTPLLPGLVDVGGHVRLVLVADAAAAAAAAAADAAAVKRENGASVSGVAQREISCEGCGFGDTGGRCLAAAADPPDAYECRGAVGGCKSCCAP